MSMCPRSIAFAGIRFHSRGSPYGPVPLLRHGDTRANVIPHPLPALALGYRSKNVEATLEPVIKAMSDLHRFMLGVISGVNTLQDCLRALDCEVAMELNHGVRRIDKIRSVHLDFVVVLSASERRSQDQDEDLRRDCEMSVTHRLSGVTTSREEDYQQHNEFGVANR
jgi:hypothetical protein